MKRVRNVITEVVQKNLCSGCGVCVGLSDNCLNMQFDRSGQLIPELLSACKMCGVCLSVCPFYDNACNASDEPLGNYIENYIGYSSVNNERERGSSGGLATRISKTLLEKKFVDGVVVVKPSKINDRLFDSCIVSSSEKIISYAGSKYYPIEFSSTLNTIKERNGEYALIGLPCVIRALYLVKQKYPYIGKKIKYLLGLTCGHQKNKNYTSFLMALAGVKSEEVIGVQYRSKNNTNKAINYGFKVDLRSGVTTKQLNFLDSLVKEIWCGRYFSLSSCFHCRDLFAEYADISFMDAWLKPYIDNPSGTSIIVVRDNQINKLLEEEVKKGNIILNVISKKEVKDSQREGLNFKKAKIINKKFLLNKWLSDALYSKRGYFLKTYGAYILRLYASIFKV